MELKVVLTTYECDLVELTNGVKVTDSKFSIKDGKVRDIDRANVTVSEDEMFTFSAWTSEDKLKFSIRNVSEDVQGQAIVKEFVDYLEASFAQIGIS